MYPALQAQTLRGLYQVLEEVVDLSVKRQVGRICADVNIRVTSKFRCT